MRVVVVVVLVDSWGSHCERVEAPEQVGEIGGHRGWRRCKAARDVWHG